MSYSICSLVVKGVITVKIVDVSALLVNNLTQIWDYCMARIFKYQYYSSERDY